LLWVSDIKRFNLLHTHQKSNGQTLFLYSEKQNNWQTIISQKFRSTPPSQRCFFLLFISDSVASFSKKAYMVLEMGFDLSHNKQLISRLDYNTLLRNACWLQFKLGRKFGHSTTFGICLCFWKVNFKSGCLAIIICISWNLRFQRASFAKNTQMIPSRIRSDLIHWLAARFAPHHVRCSRITVWLSPNRRWNYPIMKSRT